MTPYEPNILEAMERHVKEEALRANLHEALAGLADRMRNQA